MFKTWQIFVFSLIPLALVFAGVFIGSIHGSDSELEVFPTPAPAATPRSLARPGSGDFGDERLNFAASHLSSQRMLSTPQSNLVALTTTDLTARLLLSVPSETGELSSQGA